MLALERRQNVLESLRRDRSVVVTDLARRFGVTEETVRRDLQKLEKEGLVSRTHGGAVSPEPTVEGEDLPYLTRQTTNSEAKRRIALHAAQLVPHGAAVMLDSSSTAFEVLPRLKDHRDLTLITNSVRIVAHPGVTDHAILSVGGELRRRSMTFVGPVARQAIAQFNADYALISCKALSQAGGVMDASVADAEIKRAFIAGARRVCLLVDGDKFDGSALTEVCSFEPIHTVITDRAPSESWRRFLTARKVELIY
jgi:DeoR/GlpR family transcriptional regulator of sugar metabolism